MILSKDIFSNCDLIIFELTSMEQVRGPSSTLEKPSPEFQVLAPSTDFSWRTTGNSSNLGTVFLLPFLQTDELKLSRHFS